MKNKSVLKAFGIMLFITFILTWVVPSSIIGDGVTIGKIAPTGWADIFTSLEVVAQYFLKPAIFVLFVGMFYGVANKSGALKGLVDYLVAKFKKRKALFVIVTVLFYSLVTALTGIYFQMFMFIPLSIAVLIGLKYNKVQSILATVGASTIGLLAEISNSMIKAMASTNDNPYLWIKVPLLVVLVALTILYILKVSQKKDEKKEDSIMFVPQARDAKKKVNVKGLSLAIVLCLTFVVFVLGLTPWSNADVFSKAYTAIKNVKLVNFNVFDAILGKFEVFGSWTYNSIYPTIGLGILVLSLSTHLSLGELFESAIEGAKKVMSLAILTALMSLIVIFSLNSGFVGTILNSIAKNGNVALAAIGSIVGAPFMTEETYALQYLMSTLFYSVNKQELLSLYGLIIQTTYNTVMLIAPSSILLMIGLAYVEEGYCKWVKYIWKFVLAVFVATLISITVATLI
ncbi:MAG: hypothetical protein II119_00570 [Bacilli bacterium]|nr:hypothetical protein [Bacilli bacterium]MBQ6282525.1 hypothetical protein [Bacilli bacterium]